MASLSDGERQRVMVARTLAQQPQVLLLDEVTSYLDLPRRGAFFGTLLDGAPEDLILDGHFSRVFAAENVSLDEAAVHFELRRAPTRWSLRGKGLRAEWRQCALERVNIGVRPSADSIVEVTPRDWTIDGVKAASIAGVLACLSRAPCSRVRPG